MYLVAGDQRNALYAKLGVIRSLSEHHPLPETSEQLAKYLDSNPILQTDKELRMFCLIVKGDIDGEFDSRAMREDWQEVATLARGLGDLKWQYRSLAQLGIAAFYDGDLETASKNVGGALAEATKNGDTGAQIRFMTALGTGLVESKLYDQAIPYFDNASKVAAAAPDAGFPFNTNEQRVTALMVTSFAAEHDLATIVGTKTAGNVLGAANFKVGSGYWVRLPIFGWYTSRGESLDGKGVTPDISVDVDPCQLISGVDQQMDKALEVIGTFAKCSFTNPHPEWHSSSSQSGSRQTLSD
jgi:hypothetical protein